MVDLDSRAPKTTEWTARSTAVIGAAFVGVFFSGAIVTNSAVAVFMGQIAHDRGWGRAAIGGAATFIQMGTAIAGLTLGHIVDRHGSRRVLLPLTILSGLVLLSFPVASRFLIGFYAAHILIGLCSPGGIAYSKLISAWFFRSRGIALTSLGVGVFVSQIAVPPIAKLLMDAVGWKWAYSAFGSAELLIAFPVLLAFFRERRFADVAGNAPTIVEIRPDGAPAISVLQAMRMKSYWLLMGAQVAGIFAMIGIGTHAIGIQGEHGVGPDLAVLGLSLFAAGGLFAQIASGLLLDRFDTPRILVPFAVMSLAGLVSLHIAGSASVAMPAVLLFGMGCGGQTSMISYFTTRYFGVRNFSKVYGSLLALMLLLGSPGAILVGTIFDHTGSYHWALIAVEALLGIAVVLSLVLPPYPYPTDQSKAEMEDEELYPA